MVRYFKQDALTKETITEDGWYKTGDIGQWESDGTLSLIDRIKNLVRLCVLHNHRWCRKAEFKVKLQNGEYIALDKLESIYKACGMSLRSNGADGRCGPVHLYLRTALCR